MFGIRIVRDLLHELEMGNGKVIYSHETYDICYLWIMKLVI